MPNMTELQRGLTLTTYGRAFNAGAKAYHDGEGEADIDKEQDKFCAFYGIHHTHPKAQAWMDGWVNMDESPAEFLKRKWNES